MHDFEYHGIPNEAQVLLQIKFESAQNSKLETLQDSLAFLLIGSSGLYYEDAIYAEKNDEL